MRNTPHLFLFIIIVCFAIGCITPVHEVNETPNETAFPTTITTEPTLTYFPPPTASPTLVPIDDMSKINYSAIPVIYEGPSDPALRNPHDDEDLREIKNDVVNATFKDCRVRQILRNGGEIVGVAPSQQRYTHPNDKPPEFALRVSYKGVDMDFATDLKSVGPMIMRTPNYGVKVEGTINYLVDWRGEKIAVLFDSQMC